MNFKNRVKLFFILTVFLFSIFPFRIFCHVSYSHKSQLVAFYKVNEHSDCPICTNHFFSEFDNVKIDFINQIVVFFKKYDFTQENYIAVFTINSNNKSPPQRFF